MGLRHMGGRLSEVTPLVLTDSPPAHPPEQGGSVLGLAACCVSHAVDVSTRTEVLFTAVLSPPSSDRTTPQPTLPASLLCAWAEPLPEHSTGPALKDLTVQPHCTQGGCRAMP